MLIGSKPLLGRTEPLWSAALTCLRCRWFLEEAELWILSVNYFRRSVSCPWLSLPFLPGPCRHFTSFSVDQNLLSRKLLTMSALFRHFLSGSGLLLPHLMNVLSYFLSFRPAPEREPGGIWFRLSHSLTASPASLPCEGCIRVSNLILCISLPLSLLRAYFSSRPHLCTPPALSPPATTW